MPLPNILAAYAPDGSPPLTIELCVGGEGHFCQTLNLTDIPQAGVHLAMDAVLWLEADLLPGCVAEGDRRIRVGAAVGRDTAAAGQHPTVNALQL